MNGKVRRNNGLRVVRNALLLTAWVVAGALVTSAHAAAGSAAESSMNIQCDDHACTVTWDGKTVMRYRKAAGVPKAYVAELAPPGGQNILRDSSPDHPHHHGLMFAVGVDGVDYWAEFADSGRQVEAGDFHATSHQTQSSKTVAIRHALNWIAPSGNTQLLERRSILLHHTQRVPHATLLVWRSDLRPAEDKASVELWGREYFGLGMRFVAALDGGNDFRNANGGRGVEGTNRALADWCAYTAKLDGTPVTTVVYGLPGKSQLPTQWFTMNQGFTYISATLGLAEKPWVFQAGQSPLSLRYGIAIFDGTPTDAEIQTAYEELCNLVKEEE